MHWRDVPEGHYLPVQRQERKGWCPTSCPYPYKWRTINWLHVIVVLVFSALRGLAPAYVPTIITPYEPRRQLVALCCVCLAITWNANGRRSFSCAGPVLWNSLREDMRLADSLNSFKSHLKTHYFKLAYNLTIRTLYIILYLF